MARDIRKPLARITAAGIRAASLLLGINPTEFLRDNETHAAMLDAVMEEVAAGVELYEIKFRQEMESRQRIARIAGAIEATDKNAPQIAAWSEKWMRHLPFDDYERIKKALHEGSDEEAIAAFQAIRRAWYSERGEEVPA